MFALDAMPRIPVVSQFLRALQHYSSGLFVVFTGLTSRTLFRRYLKQAEEDKGRYNKESAVYNKDKGASTGSAPAKEKPKPKEKKGKAKAKPVEDDDEDPVEDDDE